jgi:hypothetical protein
VHAKARTRGPAEVHAMCCAYVCSSWFLLVPLSSRMHVFGGQCPILDAWTKAGRSKVQGGGGGGERTPFWGCRDVWCCTISSNSNTVCMWRVNEAAWLDWS